MGVNKPHRVSSARDVSKQMSVDSKVSFMTAGCTASDIDNSTGFRLLSIDDKHVTSTFPSNVSVTVPAYSYPSAFHDGPPSLPMVQGLQVNSIGHCLYYRKCSN